jgi:hypothetical protein
VPVLTGRVARPDLDRPPQPSGINPIAFGLAFLVVFGPFCVLVAILLSYL